MPFTTIGFAETASLSSLTAIQALSDQHVRINDDDVVVPELDQVLAAFAISANIENAALASPSLRRMFYPRLSKLCVAANLPDNQAVDEGGAATYTIYGEDYINDFRDTPIPLVQSEKLNFQIDNGGNSEQMFAVVFLGDGTPVKETGPMFTIKATNTDSLTANVWTNGALTFAEDLPAGRYAVVGMAYKSATAIAARLVFIGGKWRPGCIAKSDYNRYEPAMFRLGQMGVFGEFEFDQPPTVDFLANAADSSQEIWLDLIQVREGR
jgi:hypothetical protein